MTKAKGLRAKPRPTEPQGPLAKRDELASQRQIAYDTYAAQTQKRVKAEHDRGRAEQTLRTVESARAKGTGTDEHVEAVQAQVNEAHRAYDKALGRANRALDATKELDTALAQLYSDEFPVFADEAELASKRADVALNEMLSAYRRAQEAWAAAQVAWGPLCTSVRIAHMPPFPLTDHELGAVIRGWNARPPGIDVLDVDEDVEEAAVLEGLDVAG